MKRVDAAAQSARGRLPLAAALPFLAPLAILLGFVFLLPVGRFLASSVLEPSPGFGRYARLVADPFYIEIILRTARIAIATTLLSLLLGYPIAALMRTLSGWRAALVTASVLLPMWTSALIRSYAWIEILQRGGIINSLLLSLGVIERPLNLLYTEGAVLVAMTHVLLPFMILPIHAALRNTPPDLDRAASNLGATEFQRFRFVTWPLSLPGVFAGSLMVFILAFGFYITPALVGGPKVLTIAMLVTQQAFELNDWPFAAALSAILLAMTLGLAVLFQKLLRLDRLVAHG